MAKSIRIDSSVPVLGVDVGKAHLDAVPVLQGEDGELVCARFANDGKEVRAMLSWARREGRNRAACCMLSALESVKINSGMKFILYDSFNSRTSIYKFYICSNCIPKGFFFRVICRKTCMCSTRIF